MAFVTENPGKWNPGKFPQDWETWTNVAPVEYGQETLFEEWEGGCLASYKPYPWATHFQSIRAMCRAALLPDSYEIALAIFRNWSCRDVAGWGFLYVDTRCRLVRNQELKYSLYS